MSSQKYDNMEHFEKKIAQLDCHFNEFDIPVSNLTTWNPGSESEEVSAKLARESLLLLSTPNLMSLEMNVH